jgi:hypothetical protein
MGQATEDGLRVEEDMNLDKSSTIGVSNHDLDHSGQLRGRRRLPDSHL